MTDAPKRPRRPAAHKPMKDLSEIESLATRIAELETALDDARNLRASLMVRARVDGWQWPAISTAARLSRPSVNSAVMKANNGVLPTPRQR